MCKTFVAAPESRQGTFLDPFDQPGSSCFHQAACTEALDALQCFSSHSSPAPGSEVWSPLKRSASAASTPHASARDLGADKPTVAGPGSTGEDSVFLGKHNHHLNFCFRGKRIRHRTTVLTVGPMYTYTYAELLTRFARTCFRCIEDPKILFHFRTTQCSWGASH